MSRNFGFWKNPNSENDRKFQNVDKREWDLEVVQRQKGFRLQHLLFQVLDTVSGRFLRVHHDGFHVFAQQLGNGNVVALVNRMTHVDDPVVDAFVESFEILNDLLFLASTSVFVFIDSRFAQIFRYVVQFVLYNPMPFN